MKPLTAFLLLYSFVFMGASCDKSTDPLPPATQNGAHTGGCFINGNAFIAGTEACSFHLDPQERGPGSFMFDQTTKSLRIELQGCASTINRNFFTLKIENYNGPGIYICNTGYYDPYSPDPARVRANYIAFSEGGSAPKKYVTTETSIGTITITHLILIAGRQAFVSGTFEAKLINLANYTDSLTVTQGRFDLRVR